MERVFINNILILYLYRKPKKFAIHLSSQTAFYLVLPRQLEWNLPSPSIYVCLFQISTSSSNFDFFVSSPSLRVSKSPSDPQFICPKHQSNTPKLITLQGNEGVPIPAKGKFGKSLIVTSALLKGYVIVPWRVKKWSLNTTPLFEKDTSRQHY